MNLAHLFTILRIIISPLFPLFYLGYENLGIPFIWVPYCMLGVLIISESSDLFDGFFARRANQVTNLGKVLDPIADSLTHVTLFLTLTRGVVGLSLPLVLVLLYRDFFMSVLRILCALQGVALAARWSGKVKTVLQGMAAFLIIALLVLYTQGLISLAALQTWSFWILLGAVLPTLFSMIDYLIANRIHIRQSI